MPDDEPGTPTEETAPPTPAVTPAPPTPGAVKKESGKKSNKSQSKQVRFRLLFLSIEIKLKSSIWINNLIDYLFYFF